jgi:hypothetical protein
MYADHDGNVYKNTGDGWEKYNNGSWNSVTKPSPNFSQATQSQASQSEQNRSSESNQQRSSSGSGSAERSSQTQNLDQEAQNRSRGSQESIRFQQFQRSGRNREGAGATSGGSRGGGRERRWRIRPPLSLRNLGLIEIDDFDVSAQQYLGGNGEIKQVAFLFNRADEVERE